jgi:hypothetical protein
MKEMNGCFKKVYWMCLCGWPMMTRGNSVYAMRRNESLVPSFTGMSVYKCAAFSPAFQLALLGNFDKCDLDHLGNYMDPRARSVSKDNSFM